jgi:hypothetical protein
MIFKNLQNNKGYTLLFAVLVSSLVLAVGISILNVSKKEFLLASSARESVTAFYAADTGIECAAFHDDSARDIFSNVNYSNGVNCTGNHFNVTVDSSVLGTDLYTFDMNLDNGTCAIVEVIKVTYPVVATNIRSSGYNMGWNSANSKCEIPSPRRVERVLYYSY